MSWRTVVITQHAKLSYSGRMMIVQTDSKIHSIPIEDISVLMIATTQAVITSALVAKLSQNQSKIIFVDNHYLPVSETCCYYSSSRTLESLRKQFEWDEYRKENLWTHIVAGKISNQTSVIESLGIDTEDLEKEADKLEFGDATNREAVVARKYFELLFGSGFKRRSDDEEECVNAASNYGYSIILSSFSRAIVANGCLTHIGIHHSNNQNEYNLASDLMEPFRPIIDLYVAVQNFTEFSRSIRMSLINLLNQEIQLNGQKMRISTAIEKHVSNCIRFLNGDLDNIEIEVDFTDEVQSYEINGHV